MNDIFLGDGDIAADFAAAAQPKKSALGQAISDVLRLRKEGKAQKAADRNRAQQQFFDVTDIWVT